MSSERTKKMVLCALFTALIIAGTFIRIPIPVVPFTLQSLFTMLAGLLLGGKWGLTSVLIYIGLGLAGVPVFTQGGGIGYVLQPSFGYLIGYAIGTFVAGTISEKRENPSYKRLFAASISGLFFVYFIGTIYFILISRLYLNDSISIGALLVSCVLLPAPKDLAINVLVVILAKRLLPLIKDPRSIIKLTYAEKLKKKVLKGYSVSKEDALRLYDEPLEKLTSCADEIRRTLCGNRFDACTIINGKCGKCSENCRFCAQSAHNATGIDEYPLLSADEIAAAAKRNADLGVLRFSIVTSGKKLSDKEVDDACAAVAKIKEITDISVCGSFGLLGKEQFEKLKAAGVERIHNNLETSRGFFPSVCTTHGYDDKIAAIKAAQSAGLDVCSGGIMGLGETPEDRIDMALELRGLGVKSVPINVLNPIAGTPFADNERLTDDEVRRIVAVYRFILPDASIRLAGGRGLLSDKGKSCFSSGANAAISGDMLTTAGITVAADFEMLKELGFEVKKD